MPGDPTEWSLAGSCPGQPDDGQHSQVGSNVFAAPWAGVALAEDGLCPLDENVPSDARAGTSKSNDRFDGALDVNGIGGLFDELAEQVRQLIGTIHRSDGRDCVRRGCDGYTHRLRRPTLWRQLAWRETGIDGFPHRWRQRLAVRSDELRAPLRLGNELGDQGVRALLNVGAGVGQRRTDAVRDRLGLTLVASRSPLHQLQVGEDRPLVVPTQGRAARLDERRDVQASRLEEPAEMTLPQSDDRSWLGCQQTQVDVLPLLGLLETGFKRVVQADVPARVAGLPVTQAGREGLIEQPVAIDPPVSCEGH